MRGPGREQRVCPLCAWPLWVVVLGVRAGIARVTVVHETGRGLWGFDTHACIAIIQNW